MTMSVERNKYAKDKKYVYFNLLQSLHFVLRRVVFMMGTTTVMYKQV